LNIGEVAKMAELPIKTIRYYEEIGFIKPKRSANGYRSFRVSDVHKLAFLGRARSLGFSIGDCRALLQLYENDTRASADVKQIAQENLARIDAKVKEFQAMRNTLSDLIDSCAGDDRPACPILSDLATLS
jgi:Cu(I)-responsive transcriptional regulator